MNSRIVTALAISAGLALVITGVFYQIALRDAGAKEVPMSEVVTATKDLEVGSEIQPGDLRVEPWPAGKLPEGAHQDIELVIGRVPVSRILAQEPVLDRRLAAPGAGVGLATKVPDGMRAMSIRVDDVNGVAGFVMPEARVDVLITGTPQGDPQSGRMTKTILGNVRVLSAGEHLAPDSTGRPQRVPVVTLLLTPEQSEMVTLAQTQGRIQLVLRNGKDEEVAETTGVREDDLFGGAPKTINVSKPAVRPVVVAPPPPPPPPPIQIEVLRGNELSTQSFESAQARP
jgi:pilus assembly protein CpaB